MKPTDLVINGERRVADVDPSTPLLWVLRDTFGLTGTKYGCGIAQCGACTVDLEGDAVRSCVTPLSRAAGKRVTTVEGLSKHSTHPVQRAWLAEQVPQCGYCQSGQQVLGTLGKGIIAYNLALTNGAVAGILSDGDFDSGKDLVARIYARPFLTTGPEALRQLAVGLGASTGVHRGSVDNPQLPVLLTYGGQAFFSFKRDRVSNDVAVAAGRVERLVPHATWSWGPLAAYADAVWIRERVRTPMST